MKDNIFDSENNWPFLIREENLVSCLKFINSNKNKRRIIKIFGESGCGKSFFAKELLITAYRENQKSLNMYLDFPASDLESFQVIRKAINDLGAERIPTRENPNHVNLKTVNAWMSYNNIQRRSAINSIYKSVKYILKNISIIGDFINYVTPQDIVKRDINLDGDVKKLFSFLAEHTTMSSAIIVLDNIQFCPTVIISALEQEISRGAIDITIIAIERTNNSISIDWSPPFKKVSKELYLSSATKEDISELVSNIFPDIENSAYISDLIYKRSEGNLKEAWYFLKLIHSKHEMPHANTNFTPYEGVINSLSGIDQLILRLVTLLLGGLTISSIVDLLNTNALFIDSTRVDSTIKDLITLGLVKINSHSEDKVKLDHEKIAFVVNEIITEDTRLEFRSQVVRAIAEVLDSKNHNISNRSILCDRLLGIVTANEIISNHIIQSIIVEFISYQDNQENYGYLYSLFNGASCFDALDVFPEHIIKSLLNAIQKVSKFSFGYAVIQKLRRSNIHTELANVYESKYLVQEFKYDDAYKKLETVSESKEKEIIAFNIMLNKCDDDKCRTIVRDKISNKEQLEEYDFVILRNSCHLFSADKSEKLLKDALAGFSNIGKLFGIATCHNNLGIVFVSRKDYQAAFDHFTKAKNMFNELSSNEVYQPIVNLAALKAIQNQFDNAIELIREARQAVSSNLLMDDLMLSFNEGVIRLLSRNINSNEACSLFEKILLQARRTKDLRFIQTIDLLVTQLNEENKSFSENRIVQTIQDQNLVGLEIFIQMQLQDKKINVPYILSPHWRY